MGDDVLLLRRDVYPIVVNNREKQSTMRIFDLDLRQIIQNRMELSFGRHSERSGMRHPCSTRACID